VFVLWSLGCGGIIACGEFSSSAGEPTADAGLTDAQSRDEMPTPTTSDDAAADSGEAGGPSECRLDQPFGAPKRLDGINTGAQEQHPWLSENELNIRFTRRGDGVGTFWVLMQASRPRRTDAFGPPTKLDAVTEVSGTDEYALVTGPTGIDVLNKGTAFNFKLYWRPAGGKYTALDCGHGVCAFPTFNHAGSAAFSADPLGDGKITEARVSSAGFDTPAELKLGRKARSPVFSRDGLTLYYGAEAPQQVWKATRTSLASQFSTEATLAMPQSAFDLNPRWLSPDGCRLYLSSNAEGNHDIYVAEKPR